MHLTPRALSLVALAAALGIATLWAGDAAPRGLWLVPLLLLAAGLAYESARVSRLQLTATLMPMATVRLGHACEFRLTLAADQDVAMQWRPALPAQLAGDAALQAVRLRATVPTTLMVRLLAVRLGEFSFPPAAARARGALGLADWAWTLPLGCSGRVLPDLRPRSAPRIRGQHRGAQPRRVAGEGSEFAQLREYRAGDPLARIAWKRSARLGRLLTREHGDERQLDLLLVVDAGMRSAATAGRLDRLGVHVNAALRLAESAARRGDRIGLLLHDGEVLTALAPAPAAVATLRVYAALAAARPGRTASEPVAAARRARALLSRPALVVWFADVDETLAATELATVARILLPPNRVVFTGVDLQQRVALDRRRRMARSERDAWLALASDEQQRRLAQARARLRAHGAPVISAAPDGLDAAVLRDYARRRP